MKKLIFALLMVVPCTAWGDTFGQTGDGTSELGMQSNTVHSTSATLTVDGAVVSKVSFRLRSEYGSTVGKFVGAIYSVSDGNPSVLLASSTVVDVAPSATAWYDFPISVTLDAGTYYFAILNENSAGSIFWQRYNDDASNPGTWAYLSSTTYPTFPDPFGTPTQVVVARNFCAYATYTTGGGEPPAAFPQILIFE